MRNKMIDMFLILVVVCSAIALMERNALQAQFGPCDNACRLRQIHCQGDANGKAEGCWVWSTPDCRMCSSGGNLCSDLMDSNYPKCDETSKDQFAVVLSTCGTLRCSPLPASGFAQCIGCEGTVLIEEMQYAGVYVCVNPPPGS